MSDGGVKTRSVEKDGPPKYQEAYFTYTALARDVLAVAVPGGAYGDWAVYIGAVPGKSHEREVDKVTRDGEKQSKRMAAFLFPQFNPAKYRP